MRPEHENGPSHYGQGQLAEHLTQPLHSVWWEKVLVLCFFHITFRPTLLGRTDPFLGFGSGPRRSSPNSALARAARTKQTVHIADVLTERGFFKRRPVFLDRKAIRTRRRAAPWLPCRCSKESELIGAIVIYRQQAQPFRRVGRIQRNADNSDRHNHAR